MGYEQSKEKNFRDADDRSAAVRESNDRLFCLAFASRAAPRPDRSVANGGRRNGFDGTGHSAFSLTVAVYEQIKNNRAPVKKLSVFFSEEKRRWFPA